MATEVGKLIFKSDIVGGTSKAGRAWQKLQFVIQVKNTQYPRKVAFDTLNADLIRFVNDTSLEQDLQVEFEVESREYQGKYHTNAKALKVEYYQEGNYQNTAPTPQPPIPDDSDDDLPF